VSLFEFGYHDEYFHLGPRGDFMNTCNFTLSLTTTVLLLLHGFATASESRPAVILEETASHTLWSEHVDDYFVTDIAFPYSYDPDGGPYPLVLITDGDMNFPIVLGTRLMMEFEGMPPAIIASVSYISREEAFAKRFRDFSPGNLPQAPVCQAETYSCGGARNFLDFISAELVPFLVDHYPIDAGNVTLTGHSLGGLFGAWVLLTAPESFQNYVLGSPALVWDDGLVYSLEEQYHESGGTLPARVYLATGSLEDDPGNPFESLRAVANHKRFTELLRSRNYSGLTPTSELIEGETHMSVIPPLLYRGLREVLATTNIDAMPSAPLEAL